MKNQKFTKTLTAAVAISMALCESAKAECPRWPSEYTLDSSSGFCVKSECNGKCIIYYDAISQDMRIEKNPNVGQDEEVNLGLHMIEGLTINNLTIGEGITGSTRWVAGYGTSAGNTNSTLTFPSTFKSDLSGGYNSPFWNVKFGTIDASALKDTTLHIPHDSTDITIILAQDSNINVNVELAYGGSRGGYLVDIICKGAKNKCDEQLSNSGNVRGNISYYSGPDGNGNWEEWSDNGKAIYADSTKAKLLETYGFDGKQTASYNYSAGGLLLSANTYDSEGNINGSYTYDAGGNLVSAYQNGKAVYLRKRYTIPEADAATQGKGPFRLDITW